MENTNRMHTTNSQKRSKIYQKLVNTSGEGFTMPEEMARYRMKFESAARKRTKDIYKAIFR